ncbi:MAG: hypothetical protein U0166_00455 [Acidobacteriota bacterium]
MVRTALFVVTAVFAQAALADGPAWRRDVWWGTGPQNTYHQATGIWLDAQDRVHVAYNAETGSPPVAHMLFDAGFDYLYHSAPLGGLCYDNSIVGDPATGDVALFTINELTVVAIDATGQELWHSSALAGTGRYPGQNGGGIVMHPSGDFIVAGQWNTTELYAARFARADGRVVWSVQHVVPGVGVATGGIAVDPQGNVVVAGEKLVSPWSPMLMRLDGATGALSPAVEVPISACTSLTSYSTVDAVAVDAAGAVYVAGHGYVPYPDPDAWAMKLDASFAPIWCSVHDDGSGQLERWDSIAVNAAGQVAVSGYDQTATGYDILTGLIGAGGTELWSATYDSNGTNDFSKAIAFDSAGNVVTGGGYGQTTPLVLLKYSPGGALIDSTEWWAVYENTIYGADVDAAGNTVLVGSQGGAFQTTVAVHKLSPSGARLWSVFGTTLDEWAHRVKTDAAGNIYLCGRTASDQWLVQKRGPSGNLIWERSGTHPLRATDLDLAPSGNLIVVGRAGTIVEYTPAGSEVRSTTLPLAGGSADGPAVVTHANGEVTIAEGGMLHLSSSFAVLWQENDPFAGGSVVNTLALDAAGSILAGGSVSGNALALGRFDAATGATSWVRTIPATGASDGLFALDVDAAGNILAGGQIQFQNRLYRWHASGALVYDGGYVYPTAGFVSRSQLREIVLNAAGTQATLALGFSRSSDVAGSAIRWDLDPLGSAGPRRVAAGEGPGLGNSNVVRTFDGAGTTTGTFVAYGAGRFGTNVATGGIETTPGDEHVTGPGPGNVYGPQVRGWSGAGAAIAKVNFYAYGTLKYGVNVASARLDADAFAEILTGAGPGEVFGPQVRAFNYDGASVTAIQKINFFAYSTLKYGVNVAGGQLDGDTFDEMLTGPGPSAAFGAQVRGFNYDGTIVSALAKVNFLAFASGTYGANPAAADVEADGYEEILAGRGPGASLAAEVATFDVDGGNVVPKGPPIVTTAGTLYGANVAGGDLEGDGVGDLCAGVGDDPAGPARVRVFRWVGGAYLPTPNTDFLAYTPSTYGTNVALGTLD